MNITNKLIDHSSVNINGHWLLVAKLFIHLLTGKEISILSGFP